MQCEIVGSDEAMLSALSDLSQRILQPTDFESTPADRLTGAIRVAIGVKLDSHLRLRRYDSDTKFSNIFLTFF